MNGPWLSDWNVIRTHNHLVRRLNQQTNSKPTHGNYSGPTFPSSKNFLRFRNKNLLIELYRNIQTFAFQVLRECSSCPSRNHCTKSIKDFFSKCDQIRSFLWFWSHLLKKSLMEDFIFCAVEMVQNKCFFWLQPETCLLKILQSE